MIFVVLLVPALAGLLAFLLRSDRARRALLVGTAVAHSAATAALWVAPPPPTLHGWIAVDPLGLLFLAITSGLFLAAAPWAAGYLKREVEGAREDFEEGVLFSNTPEAIFTGCLLLFLATMSLVALSHHFGLLWVAIEATTLASAPLIYFHRHHRSLEATWKYLMICSVGIALALLGNFLVAVSASGGTGGAPLVLEALVAQAGRLQTRWLEAAFLFLLVGYGTKMGLAPLHTWLPDAHSESPSVVSALMSGALLNCAALGILRVLTVCEAAGLGAFARSLLTGFGLLSMALAAVFIVGQTDYKRLLAYSSVEHMGVLALGIGLGGGGTFGALLHAVNHSLTKAMLFLVTGNILAATSTKSTTEVRGLVRLLPVSGVLWIAGFLAITGSPPFGPFLSEFTILRAALDQGRIGVAIAYLAALGAVFVGMATPMLRMALGRPTPVAAGMAGMAGSAGAAGAPGALREPASAVWPVAALGVLVLALGLFVPPALRDLLASAARSVGSP
ncbi:MAG: proton-conducting transporter membrane subunit [bacterium]